MRSALKIIASIYILCCVSCNTTAHTQTGSNVLSATSLKPYGRFLFDDNNNLELITSAAHFGFTFNGTQCTLYTFIKDSGARLYIQYKLDGIYQKRIKITGNAMQQIVLDAPSAGNHTAWIYKCNEAKNGPIFIQKIEGENVKPLSVTEKPLIEFIGNSITCGAASDTSDYACDKGTYNDHHNAYYAYGPRTARALNCNYILSSVSGIGIYRTWNMESPSMPQVYEKESFDVNDSLLWNFKTYTPKIVSIALGTNDLSNGDNVHPRKPFDSAVFVKNYIVFVQLVKSKYPKAIIALLSSPMVNGDKRILLQNCLTTVKQNIDSLFPDGKKVSLYFFRPMKANGCGGHPSVEDHAILAEELIPFFKNLLQ